MQKDLSDFLETQYFICHYCKTASHDECTWGTRCLCNEHKHDHFYIKRVLDTEMLVRHYYSQLENLVQ